MIFDSRIDFDFEIKIDPDIEIKIDPDFELNIDSDSLSLRKIVPDTNCVMVSVKAEF